MQGTSATAYDKMEGAVFDRLPRAVLGAPLVLGAWLVGKVLRVCPALACWVLARREGKTIRSRVSGSGLVADAVAKAVEHRVSPSEAGHDAFLTQVKHWGVELADTKPPLVMYYGRDDDLVPLRIAQWMTQALENNLIHKVCVVNGGHGLMFGQMDHILESLVEASRKGLYPHS